MVVTEGKTACDPIRKLTLPGFDFEVAKALAKSTLEAIGEGKLGYAIFTATKSA